QEFIARGPNDADVAMVYESIALHRWEQATQSQGQPYQIYYLDPTIETVSTAAIARRDISSGDAQAGQQFIDFLLAPEQQAIFVQHGFRPTNASLDLQTVPNSPWSKNIPGVEIQPSGQATVPPDRELVTEVVRLWQRAD
ncbi:MAG: substrate-binding domain-containing protein, partial [Cyanobacteria bacterium J06639_14]